ncbi:hypothetical protein PVIIG_06128 [Plasmodium vivax India VII]|uniref:VIR protein n=1 Tax=Plasmodium vivax India VII TaxID=1077284 RepID=A0A0J9SHD9_PLAVI|nr:hypothetical protein PVIIG_06128 [Plasmodium vivax India VII]
MSSDQRDSGYIRYQDYTEIKRQFDRTLDSNPDDDRFKKIIKEIYNAQYEEHLKNKTLIGLHNVLSNDDAFYKGITPLYCSYINHWLNREVQNTSNNVDKLYFPIFQKFSDKLSSEKGRKKDSTCNNYIFDLGDETINNMNFLYNLYDAYNEIISRYIYDKTKTCDNLVLLAKNYRDYIDKYYEEDKNLYNNLEYIIKEIDKITGIKTTSPCEQKIYFTKPTKLENLLEEKRKEAAELAARLAKAEADRLAKEKEARQTKEEGSRQHPDILSGSSHNGLQEILHENRELPSSSYQTGSQGFVTSRLYSRGERFDSSEWVESPTGSLLEKGYTPQRPTEYTLEGREQQSGLDQVQEDKGIQSFLIISISQYYIKKKLSLSYNYVLNSLNFLLNFSIHQLDPSLEEEEDDSVKFLEVLEDFNQISQIFKIMMVGILDMVQ